MDVEISSGAGFCSGVKRAIRIACETKERSLAQSPHLPVYTYGPLVHNPLVIGKLSSRGIITLDSYDGAPMGYLVVRSHGVPPELREKAAEHGFTIVDATCPLVKKIHRVVKGLREQGYQVAVIGQRNHPEVVGIVGHAGNDCEVLENGEEVERLKKRKKMGVVVQTTALVEKFEEIAARLIRQSFECRIFNTICFETLRRQKETRELAGRVELMLVAGGRESSNTGKLADICREAGTETYLIEMPEDLKASWFRGKAKVGITAGASTPEELLDGICGRLREIEKELKE